MPQFVRDRTYGIFSSVTRGVLHHGSGADHLASEVPQEAGDESADPTRADHTGGLAGQVETDQPFEQRSCLLARGCRTCRFRRLRERINAIVCSATAFGGIGRNTNDGDPQVVRRSEIDVVEAGAAQGDVANADAANDSRTSRSAVSLTKMHTASGAEPRAGHVRAVKRSSRKNIDT
jgi:hypothetical protein